MVLSTQKAPLELFLLRGREIFSLDLIQRRIACIIIRLGFGLSLCFRLWRRFHVIRFVFTILPLLFYLRQSFLFADFLPIRHQLFLRQLRLWLCYADGWSASCKPKVGCFRWSGLRW